MRTGLEKDDREDAGAEPRRTSDDVQPIESWDSLVAEVLVPSILQKRFTELNQFCRGNPELLGNFVKLLPQLAHLFVEIGFDQLLRDIHARSPSRYFIREALAVRGY